MSAEDRARIEEALKASQDFEALLSPNGGAERTQLISLIVGIVVDLLRNPETLAIAGSPTFPSAGREVSRFDDDKSNVREEHAGVFELIPPDDSAFTSQSGGYVFTTSKAAEYLGVSRSHLVRELLDKQIIPFHYVGTHKRVYLRDIASYKRRREVASSSHSAAGRNPISAS